MQSGWGTTSPVDSQDFSGSNQNRFKVIFCKQNNISRKFGMMGSFYSFKKGLIFCELLAHYRTSLN